MVLALAVLVLAQSPEKFDRSSREKVDAARKQVLKVQTSHLCSKRVESLKVVVATEAAHGGMRPAALEDDPSPPRTITLDDAGDSK